MTKGTRVMAVAVAALLAVVVAGCGGGGGGGGGEEGGSVEDVVSRIVGTDTNDQAQIDFFFAHITDSALEEFFGRTREECQAAAADCIGQPLAIERFEDTEVSGDSASTAIWTDVGDAFTIHLVKEDGSWKLDAVAFGPKRLPEGVTAVELTIDEYSFEFDDSAIEDGNIGFHFTNEGEEAHEIAIARINEEFDLEKMAEAVAANPAGLTDLPPGVDDFPVAGFAPPGTSGNLVLSTPLQPGDYMMMCLIQDDEGTSHAVLGLAEPFSVPE